MPDPPVHGYVLAGGQSSRMRADKALLPFGASTLLGRAVSALQHFCSDVTLVGRSSTDQCRAIPDHLAFGGPVAGIESALTDLVDRGGSWAFFLPVDMPLLPGELLRALVALWRGRPLTHIAFPIAGGYPQPVVSLVHVTALDSLRQSLKCEQRRLRPALETAADHIARGLDAPLDHVLQTPVLTSQDGRACADKLALDWLPSTAELQLSRLWFANANTPEELAQLRRGLNEAQHLCVRNPTPGSPDPY